MELGFDNDVVDIHLYGFADKVFEGYVSGSDKGRQSIFETVRHTHIAIESLWVIKVVFSSSSLAICIS